MGQGFCIWLIHQPDNHQITFLSIVKGQMMVRWGERQIEVKNRFQGYERNGKEGQLMVKWQQGEGQISKVFWQELDTTLPLCP